MSHLGAQLGLLMENYFTSSDPTMTYVLLLANLLTYLLSYLHDDIFWQLLQSLPLVDARRTHQESLARMERTCLDYRNQLERASESVAALGLDLPKCVNYHSLNLIALAVQPCREIQQGFGNLRCRECM